MKSTTLLITAAFLTAGLMSLPSLAIAESVDGRAQALAEQLDLDASQTEAIDGLITEHRDSRREQMSSQDLRGPERREHMRAEREALHGSIRDVLTPEQADEFDSLISERHGRMNKRGSEREHMRGERHRGRRGMMRKGRRGAGACNGSGFEPDFSQLNISEGMRARLEGMHKEHLDAMDNLRRQHRDEMRDLVGDKEFEKLHMPCAPDRGTDGADDRPDVDEQKSG